MKVGSASAYSLVVGVEVDGVTANDPEAEAVLSPAGIQVGLRDSVAGGAGDAWRPEPGWPSPGSSRRCLVIAHGEGSAQGHVPVLVTR